ncbi:MAG: response regulator [Verrucomicrobiota bacterium]
MYFGIRGKVALLVVIATAASALLVAEMMSRRAAAVLREHELVDLGDEASLRAWEMVDRIEGLRDDLINITFSPTFEEMVLAEADNDDLFMMARGLCRRSWKYHLTVDLLRFESGSMQVNEITGKATINGAGWFPGADAQAGPQMHLSPIQRVEVTRNDLGPDSVIREEPVIWAVAPLGRYTRSADDVPIYVRIGMSVRFEPTARHFFAMEDAAGKQLARPDETQPVDSPNDSVFRELSQSPELLELLERKRTPMHRPTDEVEPKVERLSLAEFVDLEEPYVFQEGLPNERLVAAIEEVDDDELDDYFEDLSSRFLHLGRVSGLQAGVKQLRFLSPSRESLESLKDEVTKALEERFGDGSFRWRAQIECDQIHSWAVRFLVGEAGSSFEYLIHYAVCDDELASSIEYEMNTLKSVAIGVTALFGIAAFLIAMVFIAPLKRMTRTAQSVTATHNDRLHEEVAALVQELDIRRRDEVGDIARASKRLFEELVALHGNLERRVKERTKELQRTNFELGEANEKLKSLSHEKDAFVAKVSHDLRQPLNAIFLQVEALKLSDLDEMQRDDVERIHSHASRELNLVNDILEYQKIIMGAETLQKDTIEIPLLLQELADAHAPVVRDRGVEFDLQFPEDIGEIVTDDRRLRQILGNLLSNAGKFTKEGIVSLGARTAEIEGEEWVEFTVSDSGRGMSPEEQAKAFVPFVSNKKDNAGGSGLGLSICRELTQQMGGRIGFVSELNKGTHFSVFLPRASAVTDDAEEQPQAVAEPTIDIVSGPSLGEIKHDGTILVIDDDEQVRGLLNRLLSTEGYTVLTAADGAEGLRMAKTHRPDAVTLDVIMPGEADGWYVLHQLKDDPATTDIPVIMVSVLTDEEKAYALGIEDYVVKPIDIHRLSRVISRTTGDSPQRNLLIVDDDIDSLEAMETVLTRSGWKITTARDGLEALDVLKRTRPAAIVLDLMMPEMDGFEFIQHLQRDKHLRTIPVIVMTGAEPTAAQRRFLEKRVANVFHKGDDSPDALLESLSARLKPRSERA